MSSSRIRADKTIDCIGLHCPEPVFRTRIELDRMASGEVLEVIADDPGAEEDIKRLVTRLGHEILSLECEEDKVRFFIKRR
ncbi:MAG: sulfurtransferase TusA family protein [Candidatus Bathyarchaeia archaeon]|nr:sulfurtransferase TusA family protein [Candidatus Bathyarchaeota archaeon]